MSKRRLLLPLLLFHALMLWPRNAAAQGLEVSGGWAHATGDFGLDGFGLGAAWWFSPKVSVAANYDDTYDTSRIGTFEFTTVGAIVSKSHLQNFLVGPRFYFSGQKIKKYKITPFGEAQFGVTHLNSKIKEGLAPTISNSDSAFSWMLGAGADYPLTSHFSARSNLDLLRTHLNAAGQSRLRFVLGIAYTFGSK
jgi:Outer membrane protein beta-barrel domain